MYVPEAFLLPEVQAGFVSSLDRFEAYLAPDSTGKRILTEKGAAP